MYHGVQYNKLQVAVAVVGVLAGLAGAGAIYWVQERAKDTKNAIQQTYTRQQQELSSLVSSGVNEEKLTLLRQRAEAYTRRLVPQKDLQTALASLGNDWVYSEQKHSKDAAGGFAAVVGEVRNLNTSVAEWPKVIEAIDSMEALSPILGITEVALTTEGDLVSRRFSEVRFLINLRVQSKPVANPVTS